MFILTVAQKSFVGCKIQRMVERKLAREYWLKIMTFSKLSFIWNRLNKYPFNSTLHLMLVRNLMFAIFIWLINLWISFSHINERLLSVNSVEIGVFQKRKYSIWSEVCLFGAAIRARITLSVRLPEFKSNNNFNKWNVNNYKLSVEFGRKKESHSPIYCSNRLT